MIIKPGNSYISLFTTSDPLANGVAKNADSLPTAVANKNGSDDVAFVLTVTNLGTGKYKITGTVPLTYTTNDNISIYVNATVSGIVSVAIVASFLINEDVIIANSATVVGLGDTAVDEDTGGIDNLRFVDSGGHGIDNATIKIYLKSDYDANNRENIYIQASGITTIDGRFEFPLYIDSNNTYTVVFYKQGYFKVSTKEITI